MREGLGATNARGEAQMDPIYPKIPAWLAYGLVGLAVAGFIYLVFSK